ncbi:MAG: TonB-dependent receptor [Saprospiraceae bacterium]|nr:TonB-dependent receptor [Saprospiraceae bacterium]
MRMLLVACFALGSMAVQAQLDQELSVTANLQEQTLLERLEALNQRIDTRLYYKASEIPELTLPAVNYADTPLATVLEECLSRTFLGYASYRSSGIVIMPKQVIDEVYTANYYKVLEEATVQEAEEPSEEEESHTVTIGDIQSLDPSGETSMKVTITDAEDGQPIIGANVQFTGLGTGTITDENGAFEFRLPVGSHEMIIKYVGYEDLIKEVNIYSNGEVALQMDKGAINLDEVTVSAQGADAGVRGAQVGVTTIDVKNIKKIPALFGEADVIKNLILHPGVSTIGEGATGFNVRGGDVDQNLILQDEGIFFNSSHALGFFSTFNADLISNVNLYKGNIPASYGGRLASAMDVEMRDGDFERFRLKGGVGPVSGRLSLEGPIVKDKVSFVVGGRSTYSDWLLKRINVLEVSRSSAFFYDLNGRLTIKPNARNTLTFSGYNSQDEFIYNEEFGFDYSTTMAQFEYKSIFSDKTFNKLSAVGSQYKSSQADLQGVDASLVSNEINYLKFKNEFTYSPSTDLKVDVGASAILYDILPGDQAPSGNDSEVVSRALENQKAIEGAAFANVEFNVGSALLISGGLRYSLYQFMGPQTIYTYQDPTRPEFTEITGTEQFTDGSIADYNGLEPRVSMRIRTGANTSFKMGYSRTVQYINQIFNSDSPTPNSQWQLSTKYISPMRSHNVSVGVFKNFADNLWETSLEVYGRQIDELFDFKDFADLIVNDHLETELLPGEGRAMGAELSIKKKDGPLNGWLSYTLSRSERLVEGINNNEWYPSNFDKTHDVSLILNIQPNRRNTFTINFSYSTGRPTTPPLGNYITENGLVVPIYSQRNQFRIPDYHRLDVAYTLGKGYKKDKKIQTSWTLSVYNVYARRNAYSVFFTQAAFRQAQANKLAVIGSAIPSLTLNFEIL